MAEVTSVETVIDNAVDDVDELSVQLAAFETVSATRHTELNERINECRENLVQLSNRIPVDHQAENPILSQLLQLATEQRTEIESLKREMTSLKDSMLMTQAMPSESIAEPERLEAPVLLNPDGSIEEPAPEDTLTPEPPKPQRKFRLL